jgi:iron complex outermembrane recepter protein
MINYLKFVVLLLGIISATSISSSGQNINRTVTGRVTDTVGRPIAYASISVLKMSDSSLVKLGVCDNDGYFRLEELKEDTLLVQISAVGFVAQYMVFYTTQLLNVDIGLLKLLSRSSLSAEAVVFASKPPVQVKTDRIILNVSGSINAMGSSVLELLRKAPGVRVTGDESIIINGKEGIQVYLDGKATNVFGPELTSLLKSISSSNVESVEIITNPSARYEAAGNAGIINIRTKKNKSLGFNGSMSFVSEISDYAPKFDAGVNANYRGKKFNIFGNYNHLNGDYRLRADYYREQENTSILNFFDQKYVNTFFNRAHNFKVGTDLFLSSKSTLGFVLNGSIINNDLTVKSVTKIFKNLNTIDSVLNSDNTELQNYRRSNYNVNYKYTDTSGKELSIDFDYGSFGNKTDGNQPNIYYNNAGIKLSERLFSYFNESIITAYAGKFDFQQKLFRGVLSVGGKLSDVTSNNKLRYSNVVSGVGILDTSRSNTFEYKERIRAGYIAHNFDYKKFSFQMGFRLEATQSKGVLATLNNVSATAVDTAYVNLFPNIAVNFRANTNHVFGFSYNKRIDRPIYQDLNPFLFVFDELSFVKGNPFLKPQYTDNFQTTHTFQEKLTTSFSYSRIKNFIFTYRDTLGGGKTFQSTINLDKKEIFAITLSYQTNLASWWSFNVNATAHHDKLSGPIGKSYLSISQNTFEASTNNSFSLPKNWSAELFAFYNTRFLDPPAIVRPQWSVEVGLQKKALNDALTVRLGCSDVFNSLDIRLVRNFGGLFYTNRFKWETRRIKLSLSYKFGRKNIKEPRNRNSGLEEEKRRIKS